MSDLKPCPFCNGKKGEPMLEELQPDIGYDWRVRCYGCSAEVTPREHMRGNKAKLEVIKAWNTRPELIEDITADKIIQKYGENFACKLLKELEEAL